MLFEIIGIVFVGVVISAMCGVAALFAIARADGRDLRRYVIRQPYADNAVLARTWTFVGARRVARRRRGTRIFDTYRLATIVVDRKWSELRNGYQGDHLPAGQLARMVGLSEAELDARLAVAMRRGDVRTDPEAYTLAYSVSDAFRALDITDTRAYI